MSKLFENKNILHITVEVIILISIVLYFSQKTKKIAQHINDLMHRIEEQDDMLQRHEELLASLLPKTSPKLSRNDESETPNINFMKPVQKLVQKPILIPSVQISTQIPIQTLPTSNKVEEIYEDEDQSDEEKLDTELKNELEDLNMERDVSAQPKDL